MQEDKVNQMILERMQQDNQAKIEYAKRLVENGNLDGLYEMGIRHLYGWGVEWNAEKAIEYLRKAADGNHPGACYELAKRYVEGDFSLKISKNFDTAERYIQAGFCSSGYNPNYKDFNENIEGLKKVVDALSHIDT